MISLVSFALASAIGTVPVLAQTTPAPATDRGFAPVATPTPKGATLAPVLVPGGTPLKIVLVDQLASNKAHAEDRFSFHSLEAVTVEGFVVVPAGAMGEGHVVSAESAGGNGHPGKLALQFDWIYSSDNLRIKLSDVPSANDGDGAKGAASTAAIASYLVLGPLGLFAHNFVHGKDVIVQTDRKIPVYVAQSVHVVPTTKVTTADGFAH